LINRFNKHDFPQNGNQFDFLFKFIVIGDPSCGKSCLLNRFIKDKWEENSIQTLGVEFGSKTIEIGDRVIKLQIWDTAGQERFRSITRTYYRNAAGCILVYDISKRESYNNLIVWLNEAREVAIPGIVFILVGNKSDLDDSRKVTFLEASRFAQENDLLFLETSAKLGKNVEDVFVKTSRAILTKIDTGILNPDEMGNAITRFDKKDGNKLVSNDGGENTENQDEGCKC